MMVSNKYTFGNRKHLQSLKVNQISTIRSVFTSLFEEKRDMKHKVQIGLCPPQYLGSDPRIDEYRTKDEEQDCCAHLDDLLRQCPSQQYANADCKDISGDHP